MCFSKAKTIIENYNNYEAALFKIKGMIKNLRKSYDDETITLAFQEAMKQKS